ncbi:MAG: zinc ribbon domain-containing protein [Deltaproteobacteria bacterium]|nr:zinc ribbon domain-containing protein [Deltaproteobacteria bacterium]
MIFYPGALEKRGEEWIQVGNRCRDCGKTSYPAMELCTFCSSDRVEKAPLSKVGTVFSYTVTRLSFYVLPIIPRNITRRVAHR